MKIVVWTHPVTGTLGQATPTYSGPSRPAGLSDDEIATFVRD